jgi:uncharacterized membrane protein YdjX (TVP38/TMEM64 family)
VNWIQKILRSKFIWVFVGLVVTAIVVRKWVDFEGGPREVVQSMGIWAPLVSLFLQTITTMTPVGSLLLSVLNGALFGFWTAFVLNLTSGVLGGLGMYYLWRRGDHEFDIQRSMQALPVWFRRHAGDNLPFLILLRMVPWAGGSLADLIAGAHRVPVRTQFLSLLVGYIPGSMLYALLGAGLVKL